MKCVWACLARSCRPGCSNPGLHAEFAHPDVACQVVPWLADIGWIEVCNGATIQVTCAIRVALVVGEWNGATEARTVGTRAGGIRHTGNRADAGISPALEYQVGTEAARAIVATVAQAAKRQCARTLNRNARSGIKLGCALATAAIDLGAEYGGAVGGRGTAGCRSDRRREVVCV